MSKLNSIHYLRGIAALLVVAFHAKFMLNDVYSQKDLGNLLFQSGESGVDLFFVISGFIIALSTEKTHSYKSFIIKRFFRIYPVFFICLMIVALIKLGEYDPLRFIRSLFLLQSNYSTTGPTFGYNLLYPAWTLTYEIYFYLIFMVAMCISERHRVLLTISFIIIPFVVLQQIFIGSINLNGRLFFDVPDSLGLLKIPSSPMMIEFAYGLIAYSLFKCSRLSIGKTLFISCCILYFAIFSSGYKYGPGPINFGIGAIAITAACILYEKRHQIRDLKSLSLLGDISYSLYLIHTIVLEQLIKYEKLIPIYAESKGFTKLVLFMMISVLLSILSYRFIEQPMLGISKRLLKKYAA